MKVKYVPGRLIEIHLWIIQQKADGLGILGVHQMVQNRLFPDDHAIRDFILLKTQIPELLVHIRPVFNQHGGNTELVALQSNEQRYLTCGKKNKNGPKRKCRK